MLRFVGKVKNHAPSITAEAMKPLYHLGWTDEAISSISVCALFSYWIH